MKKLLPAIVLFLLLACIVSVADDLKTLSADDIVSLHSIRGAAISPDGEKVLFQYRVPVMEKGSYHTSIWIADLKSGKARKFTSSRFSDYNPAWSPDGTKVAFARAGEIWIISSKFGEAKQLTSTDGAVNDFAWTPDGTGLIYLVDTPLTDEKKELELLKSKRKDDGYVVEGEVTTADFCSINIADKKQKKIVTAHAGIDEFSISPDGTSIVYSTNYTGRMDDDLNFDLWLVNIEKGEKSQLTDFPGPETNPVFSPCSKMIAYLSTTGHDIEYAQSDLTLLPATPGAEPHVVTEAFDRAIMRISWHNSGDIFFSVADKTKSPLYKFNPQDEVIELVETGDVDVRDFSLSSSGEIIAFSGDNYPSLAEVYVKDKTNGKIARLTNISKQLDGFTLPEQKVIQYENDGVELEAILILPVGYEKGKKYPLICEYHGGPYGRRTNYFRGPWQILAANGYMVVSANYRGGVGYGDEFGRTLKNDFGGVDFQDGIAAVKHLINKGMVDPERLGVTGGSWGGYLTNWAITQTDMFKAAVSLFGIFSFETDMSNSIQPGFEKMYFGGHYWEGNPLYRERAPRTHMKKITTPVLIMHGERDQLTNVANSNEMFRPLKMMGKTVEFVRFPREGHGFREPGHVADYYNRMVAWFDKYLK